MASVIYNSAKVKFFNGSIDWDTDTIKVALVTSSYTPNIDSHDFFDDITNEVSGTGYSAGGKTLTTAAVNQDNTNDRGGLDGDDLSWTSSTFTCRAAIVYKSTGTASTSALIAYIDFGSDQTVSSGTFTLTWDSAGLITAT